MALAFCNYHTNILFLSEKNVCLKSYSCSSYDLPHREWMESVKVILRSQRDFRKINNQSKTN